MVALMCSLAREKGWRKGPWTSEEDKLLSEYVSMHGEGRWSSVSKFTGLNRSGKSSRLRWVNYLRPGLKKGQLTPLEEGIIIELHGILGNKWSTIAKYLPGRTDNEIKNYWRTHFGKKDKSKQKKLQRRKPNVLKQFKQKQQPKEYDVIKNTMSHVETKNETKSFETQQNNCDQHVTGFMYPTMLDQQYYTVPSTYDGIFSSTCPPETLADADLWFSLWDFDKPQSFEDYVNHFSKCIVPNHATFGVEGDSMQTTQDKNSCFHDAYDNLFHGKDMFG